MVYCLVSSIFAFGLYDRILTELEHYVEVSEAAAWDFLKNAFDTNLPTGKPTEIESPLPDRFGNLEVDCLLIFVQLIVLRLIAGMALNW